MDPLKRKSPLFSSIPIDTEEITIVPRLITSWMCRCHVDRIQAFDQTHISMHNFYCSNYSCSKAYSSRDVSTLRRQRSSMYPLLVQKRDSSPLKNRNLCRPVKSLSLWPGCDLPYTYSCILRTYYHTSNNLQNIQPDII